MIRFLRREKSCGALVYRLKNGEIELLLLKHRFGGHWSFPKGHVENGETEVETALREVREETGLAIALEEGFRQSVEYYPRPNIRKQVVYFLGSAGEGRTHRQEAEISADILNGETVRGEVTAISPTGEEKGGGSTERVIPATIRITDKNSRLIAGITARAELTLAEAKDVWVVPASAVVDREDGPCIAQVKDGAVHFIPVERGVESDIQTEVRPRGDAILEEGMEIAVSPDETLTEGMAAAAVPAA